MDAWHKKTPSSTMKRESRVFCKSFRIVKLIGSRFGENKKYILMVEALPASSNKICIYTILMVDESAEYPHLVLTDGNSSRLRIPSSSFLSSAYLGMLLGLQPTSD